jgi:hypothetical protein
MHIANTLNSNAWFLKTANAGLTMFVATKGCPRKEMTAVMTKSGQLNSSISLVVISDGDQMTRWTYPRNVFLRNTHLFTEGGTFRGSRRSLIE